MNKIPKSLIAAIILSCILVNVNALAATSELTSISTSTEVSQSSSESIVNQKPRKIPWESIINLVGIVVGASLIVWQMNRQHKSNFELQKTNHKDSIRLQLYEQIALDIGDAMKKYRDAHVVTTQAYMQYRNCLIVSMFKRIRVSYNELSDAQFAFLHSITHLMCKLEEYEIIDSNLSIFRLAFTSAHYNVQEAFFAFQRLIFDYMRFDLPSDRQEEMGTDVLHPKAPSEDDLDQIEKAYNVYEAAVIEAYCYISDLSREAQNTLLGGLFDKCIPPRKPKDKNLVVVTTDPSEREKLRKYFEDDSPFGINHKKILAEHGIS